MSDNTKVDSASYNRNAARVAKEEAELQQLMKEHMGEQDTSDLQQEAPESSEEGVASKEPIKAKEVTKEEVETKLTKEEESFKKRYGDLRRHMQDKEQEFKVKLETLESRLNKAAKNELVLPKTEREIEAWANQYPDVASIVEAIADKKASERSGDLDKRLKEIEGLRIDAKREKAEAELMAIHPDFSTIRSSDAFHGWAEEQPKWVQDAIYENVDDARSVARVIDLYKADSGISKQKSNSSDKAAASSINARGRTTPESDESKSYFRESQVNKMSGKEYEKSADAIMEAIRSGKFVYDVSRRKQALTTTVQYV